MGNLYYENVFGMMWVREIHCLIGKGGGECLVKSAGSGHYAGSERICDHSQTCGVAEPARPAEGVAPKPEGTGEIHRDHFPGHRLRARHTCTPAMLWGQKKVLGPASGHAHLGSTRIWPSQNGSQGDAGPGMCVRSGNHAAPANPRAAIHASPGAHPPG
jgi:hypothetical protein